MGVVDAAVESRTAKTRIHFFIAMQRSQKNPCLAIPIYEYSLHAGLAVGAGTAAAVLALGGVEVVADGELELLRIHDIGLQDGVRAKVRQRLKAKL